MIKKLKIIWGLFCDVFSQMHMPDYSMPTLPISTQDYIDTPYMKVTKNEGVMYYEDEGEGIEVAITVTDNFTPSMIRILKGMPCRCVKTCYVQNSKPIVHVECSRCETIREYEERKGVIGE